MFKTLLRAAALSAAPLLAVATAMPASAQAFPADPGDFWDVTGVKLVDGGSLKYAQFLATEWKKDQEFAKSKGWIKDYKVLSSLYPRDGEPDLYLVVIYADFPNAKEMMVQRDAYIAFRKKSIATLESESGGRVQFRKVLSNELMQEMVLK